MTPSDTSIEPQHDAHGRPIFALLHLLETGTRFIASFWTQAEAEAAKQRFDARHPHDWHTDINPSDPVLDHWEETIKGDCHDKNV
jgi:hypothetical protein